MDILFKTIEAEEIYKVLLTLFREGYLGEVLFSDCMGLPDHNEKLSDILYEDCYKVDIEDINDDCYDEENINDDISSGDYIKYDIGTDNTKFVLVQADRKLDINPSLDYFDEYPFGISIHKWSGTEEFYEKCKIGMGKNNISVSMIIDYNWDEWKGNKSVEFITDTDLVIKMIKDHKE